MRNVMAMLTRTRLLFLALLAFLCFMAMAPGTIVRIDALDSYRHALGFFVLAVASGAGWPRIDLRWQFLGYSVLGGAIEIGQWALGTNHTAEWDDWFVDMLAAAVGLAIVWWFRRRLVRP